MRRRRRDLEPVIWTEPEGAFRYNGSDERGVRYDVYIGVEPEWGPEVLSASDQERYTTLPKNLSERVRKLPVSTGLDSSEVVLLQRLLTSAETADTPDDSGAETTSLAG